MTKTETPIQKAIKAAGGQSRLAKAVGQTAQFIYRIKNSNGSLPTRKVSADEWARATNLSKKELFPEFQD